MNDIDLLFRCIIWDLSRSFLLRLAITIFSIILIYTMAQVNVVSLENFWGKEAKIIDIFLFQFTCQREKLESCGSKPSAKIQNHPGHRWCPLPHYILISCMLRWNINNTFRRKNNWSLLQLLGCFHIPSSSNCNKILTSWCHGNRLHSLDRAQSRSRVRVLR